MPHVFPFPHHGNEPSQREFPAEPLQHKRPRARSLMKGIGALWKKGQQGFREPLELPSHTAHVQQPPLLKDYFQARRPSLPDNITPAPDPRPSSRAIPSLPRPQTFRRQESERREKLLEIPPSSAERRTLSLDRRSGLSASAARRPLSPKPMPLPFSSAPDIVRPDQLPNLCNGGDQSQNNKTSRNKPELPPLQIPDRSCDEIEIANDDEDEEIDKNSLLEEYAQRWILNISMHFRDKSNREKFFVTYAETPTKWRRLTISLDYRTAPEGSMEKDVSTLKYQRDKSFAIYEAIRESLPVIEYYNTVTNLKLETDGDGQLHIHVREDANEIVQYPSVSLFDHVRTPLIPETEVEFVSHLSGFVYKVQVDDTTMIKKEIPGPDTVDEFLYEVNALDALVGCKSIIQLEGLVTDETQSFVKGLLISYASKGALVDVLYDLRGVADPPWHRREKWAKQIVQGLSDIHEAGFVQGDFTLSNIVIDENDDARIIDINRRGCPVGWEPPELGRLIRSGQRISMCISVKTDLFQLGMVLWALAEVVDEPDQVERPLPRVVDSTPTYFRRMVETCLEEFPQKRWSAKRLLRQFPPTAGLPPSPRRALLDRVQDMRASEASISSHRSDKEYIDPQMAVTLEDVNPRHRRREMAPSPISSGQVQYLDPQDPDSNPASSSYLFESTGSWVVPHRGRSTVSSRRGRNSPFARTRSSSATSLSQSPPSRGRRRRGSDCSFDNRVVETPLTITNALGIEFDDASTSTIEGRPIEKDVPLSVPTGGLSNGHLEDVRSQSPLLHTDSGFDERMEQEFDLVPPGPSTLCTVQAAPDDKLEQERPMTPPVIAALKEATTASDIPPTSSSHLPEHLSNDSVSSNSHTQHSYDREEQ